MTLATVLSEIVLPLTAIAISIYAIYKTSKYDRKTLKLTKELYRKSVTPILSVWNEALKEKNTLELENGGSGTAIIKKIEFQIDGKTFTKFNELVNDIIKDPDNSKFRHDLTEIALFQNYGLFPNKRIMLYKIFYGNNPKGKLEFEELTKKLSMIVYYETIYGKAETFIELNINIT